MDGLSDRELVQLASQGERRAFGALAERYREAARKLALRMLPNEEVVEELVQDALLEAYLSLDRLRDPERFRGWFCGITLNLCRSHLREQDRRSGGVKLRLADEDWRALAFQAPGPEEVAEARDLHSRVLAAIAELPEEYQEATRLFYYEALSMREIAALAGVSETVVKVRLHRARQKLRQRLVGAYPKIEEIVVDRRRVAMIEVRIADVIQHGEKTIVVLLDESGKRALPIWIGKFEGASIALGVRGVDTPRPMTFSFIANILEAMNASLEEVRVESLEGRVFFGVAKLRQKGKTWEVDARPSDVVALAARTGCPIYVGEAVMEKAGLGVQEGIDMPEDLCGSGEIPLPSGAGIDALVKEVQSMLQGVGAGGAEE